MGPAHPRTRPRQFRYRPERPGADGREPATHRDVAALLRLRPANRHQETDGWAGANERSEREASRCAFVVGGGAADRGSGGNSSEDLSWQRGKPEGLEGRY